MNYYNEWDPQAAAWLRELISERLIPRGLVDERSITEVKAEDLEGFTQCHFFAGIGGWPLALQLAGVDHRTPLWTGSPPCQPFSAAGKQLGQFDPRHLAPVFLDLISQCRPPVLFGEQVAPAIAKSWMCDLQAHLEGEDYAVGFAVLPACGVGAPHKRERLFFGAHSMANARNVECEQQSDKQRTRIQFKDASSPERGDGFSVNSAGLRSVADTDDTRLERRGGVPERAGEQPSRPGSMGRGMADTGYSAGFPGEPWAIERGLSQGTEKDAALRPDTHHGFWSDADWLGCRDGKFRPVEPGTFPLANGIPARVGRLRGYGNAIVPQVAAEFITAFMGAAGETFKD